MKQTTQRNQSIVDVLQSMNWKRTCARLFRQLFTRRKFDKRNQQLFQLLRVRAILVHIANTLVRLI